MYRCPWTPTGGSAPGKALLAATAWTSGTPLVWSHTTGSPVAASTAVISNCRSGQAFAPIRAARPATSARSASESEPEPAWSRAIRPTRRRAPRFQPRFPEHGEHGAHHRPGRRTDRQVGFAQIDAAAAQSRGQSGHPCGADRTSRAQYQCPVERCSGVETHERLLPSDDDVAEWRST
ncbi:hypothetical protein [Streptomyces sp. NBC_00096]|uniref:hypothetical protein n=1 Tax=Streptomyces sp. NBC_00096 TaxID=2975650 RepID=UPI0032501A7B